MTDAEYILGVKSTIVRSLPNPGLAVPAYPWSLIDSVELPDGAALRVRPIRPDDEPRLVELFHRLSPRTVYQRFFRAYDRLPDHWYRSFANVDYYTRLALVVDEPSLTRAPLHAVARYEAGQMPATCEIAIVVEDAWQHRGLGRLLLDALLAAAEARGFRRFTADVLAENRPMLRVLSRIADVERSELSYGVVTMEFERRHPRRAAADRARTEGGVPFRVDRAVARL